MADMVPRIGPQMRSRTIHELQAVAVEDIKDAGDSVIQAGTLLTTLAKHAIISYIKIPLILHGLFVPR